MKSIVFWQRIVSPHIFDLCVSLSDLGYEVTYIFTDEMPEDRLSLGWTIPDIKNINFISLRSCIEASIFIDSLPNDSIHLCQGLRGNGLVGKIEKILRQRKLRYFVLFEKIYEKNILIGLAKRIWYWYSFRCLESSIEGVLAIGSGTVQWLKAVRLKAPVFEFTYFIDFESPGMAVKKSSGMISFIFVGRLIELKRVDWIINAVGSVPNQLTKLIIVGDGPLRHDLEVYGRSILGSRIQFFGALDSRQTRIQIEAADCLILASYRDGWGVVASEALLSGTPVICSDICGCSDVVRASGNYIFDTNSQESLVLQVNNFASLGAIDQLQRGKLQSWAMSRLSASIGAQYLSKILTHTREGAPAPLPPWRYRN